MSNAVRAWIEKIRTAEERSVSLHIRRGDYLLALNGTPALGEAYYRRAINMMRQRVGNPQWFIFSDDIDWCRQKFVDLEGACFVTGNEDTPWEDIRLMSSCRNHIIANSTFSWWGAFLASEAGVTVCPNPWFKGMPTCADVMVPEDWLLCDSLDGGEEP